MIESAIFAFIGAGCAYLAYLMMDWLGRGLPCAATDLDKILMIVVGLAIIIVLGSFGVTMCFKSNFIQYWHLFI